MYHLPADHFLSLPRPDILIGSPGGIVDTTTLAAHDFDVDNRTGFMPPHPPLARLPGQWEPWEAIFQEAQESELQLGDKPGLTDAQSRVSETWRSRVRNLPLLPIDDLKASEVMLRRGRHVLAWIMHFYIHSLPPNASIIIPRPITIPLLKISAQLQLPPVLTYSDDVLYNWDLKTPSESPVPALDNLRSQSLFTNTNDEQEFYLTSARMELRGVEALELMRATMDEAFVGDDIAMRRITGFLHRLSTVIDELKVLLLSVREGCNPEVFYHDIRPWFKGADSDPQKREWTFEGLDESDIAYPSELSGPSAGQSSLVHALDIFLGVDRYSHSSDITGEGSGDISAKKAFLSRMQSYMPRHHRHFLNHLSNNPRPLRDIVMGGGDQKLLEAYNEAVGSLKTFRDAHIIIVTLYIIGPAGRARSQQKSETPLKGTGGTELAKFLKDVRDSTAGALLNVETQADS
ncbi:Indoleamine 2,3-dioxygenase [Armillaria nabsnona]|nr:Indoleamine 2,3-dioxygenase [Armillaria nabsnona]